MNKCILAFLLCMTSILCGCNPKTTSTSSDTTETKTTQAQPASEAAAQTQMPAEDKTAEQIIEQNFSDQGITDYESVDLSSMEASAGVSLSDYVCYHFFYPSDGLKIEAYLTAPKDQIRTDQPAPCLIYNHGGNQDYGALTSADTSYYAYQFDTICIASNYRGCGQSEGADQFGGDDVNDVIHLIDLCEAFAYMDRTQLNMIGMSRGGMMTYETLRADSRIHRAIVVSGVADCTMTYNDRADMSALLKDLIGGTPEELPKEYEKRSATCFADEIHTPLLIFHTTGDDKVSIEQVKKLTALFDQYGTDYQFISFDSDVHCDLRKEDMQTIHDFLVQK